MTKPILPALLALLLASCAAAAPGDAPRAISASDKAQGAKAHPQLLEEFGGAYQGPQAAYVERIGKQVAVQSGLSNSERDFTITLLNSPVNNAFAIPGGYVYITRQLLALMNDEAELASVLGHEVGHVAARHSSKRNTTATLGNILAAGVGILTGERLLGDLAGTAAQLYTLKFSRGQEYQADDLGIGYLRGAGYDPLAAADMLASLNAMSGVDAMALGGDARAVPTWASTHPNTADRVARARAEARRAGAGGTRNRDAFLAMLDGMTYDDDPAQGIIDGHSFRHPALKLMFTAPTDAVIANGPTQVTVKSPAGQAIFAGGALGGGGLAAHVDRVFRGLAGSGGQISYGAISSGTINGMETASASARARSGSAMVDISVIAYRFASDRAYHFAIITPQGRDGGGFDAMARSFRKLGDSEAAAIKPRRVRVVTVQPGDTVESLAARMAYSTLKLERFRALNALSVGEALRPGQKVKLIIFG